MPNANVKVVEDVAVTAGPLAVETVDAPVSRTAFGAAPYALLKVITVVHVVPVWLPLPVVIVNDPAESVEPATIAADGDVAQLAGVPIVGAVVWVDLKWALERVSEAKVVLVPCTVTTMFEVSAVNNVVPAELCTWNAVVDVFCTNTLPPLRTWNPGLWKR